MHQIFNGRLCRIKQEGKMANAERGKKPRSMYSKCTATWFGNSREQKSNFPKCQSSAG